MAKKKGGRSPQKRAQPRKTVFRFEPGEKSLALEATTLPFKVKEKGQVKMYLGHPAGEIPGHLRHLGYRYTLKMLGSEAQFMTGTSSTQVLSLTVVHPPPKADEMPVVTIVAPPGTDGVAVVTCTLLYKEQ